ncbi:aminotransferase class I/II-fold pyridoxal phosphate-dependent enzyme, partial [Faecalibaculum rodentium]
METARRMKYFRKPAFADLKACTGPDPIDFTLGSPDIAPEPSIMEAIQKAAGESQNYKYAVTALPQLIQAVQDWYHDRYSTDLDPEEICLLQGSQEALINLPLVFCNPHDGILIPDPYYPVYEQAPRLAGADVLYMPLKPENHYLPDLEAISQEDRQKAKLILVSYPNNPTGAIAPDSFYEELIRFAKENDILIIHDNAYSELVYDGQPGKSFLSFPGALETGVELNSFSKTYGMAGARLGVLAGNREAVSAYRELKRSLDYGIFLPVQYGGIEALEHGGGSIPETRQEYEQRRNLMVAEFGKA